MANLVMPNPIAIIVSAVTRKFGLTINLIGSGAVE